MKKNQREATMLAAIQRYGIPRQMAKVVEECGELAAAVALHLADPDEATRLGLLDECADVQIMLWQIRRMSQYIDMNLDARIEYKLDRLLDRMAMEVC